MRNWQESAYLGAVLIMALLVIALRVSFSYVDTGTPVPSATTSTVTTRDACQEDEPCWDCSTMGNRVCGVIPGTTAP